MKKENGTMLLIAIPLIAILFIAMGLYTYNSASSTVTRATEEMEKDQANLDRYTYDEDDYDFDSDDYDFETDDYDFDIDDYDF